MSLFGRRKDPQKEAMKYLSQIPGVAHQTYDPYIQLGQQAGGVLGQQYGQMAQDPVAFYEQLMQGYQPSKQFEMLNQAQQRAAQASAAAGGMGGTQQNIAEAAQIADRLMGEDMQRWYGNVSGLLGTGLAGEQGLYGTGFQASQGLGGDLSNVLGQQAGLAFQGAQSGNRQRNQLLTALLQGAGALGGAYFGGPAGAQAGAQMGGQVAGFM